MIVLRGGTAVGALMDVVGCGIEVFFFSLGWWGDLTDRTFWSIRIEEGGIDVRVTKHVIFLKTFWHLH